MFMFPLRAQQSFRARSSEPAGLRVKSCLYNLLTYCVNFNNLKKFFVCFAGKLSLSLRFCWNRNECRMLYLTDTMLVTPIHSVR